MKIVLEMVKNIVEKGENAGYWHFILFSKYFQKTLFSMSLKDGIVVKSLRFERRLYELTL